MSQNRTGIIAEMEQIAQTVIPDPKLARRVVSALVRQFGGCRIYIPYNDHADRNGQIKALHRAGADLNYLARQFHLSACSIYRIIQSK